MTRGTVLTRQGKTFVYDCGDVSSTIPPLHTHTHTHTHIHTRYVANNNTTFLFDFSSYFSQHNKYTSVRSALISFHRHAFQNAMSQPVRFDPSCACCQPCQIIQYSRQANVVCGESEPTPACLRVGVGILPTPPSHGRLRCSGFSSSSL